MQELTNEFSHAIEMLEGILASDSFAPDTQNSLLECFNKISHQAQRQGFEDIEDLCTRLEKETHLLVGEQNRELLEVVHLHFCETRDLLDRGLGMPNNDALAELLDKCSDTAQSVENDEQQADSAVESADIEDDPEMLAAFANETSDHLDNIESQVLELDANPDNREMLDGIFRAFHTIKGTSAFFGFHGIQGIAHEIETLLDEVREGKFAFSAALGGLIFHVRDVVSTMVEKAVATVTDVDCPAEILQAVRDFDGSSPQEIQLSTSKPSGPSAARDIVKVEANRLDSLVDLVGELVIAQSIVSDAVDNLHGVPDGLLQAKKHLASITRDLQTLSTSLRMVPLKPVFQRMKRLVRDISTQTGKDIDFIVVGESTEVDKSLVDEIADPLVHLIRNAVDHGIENAVTRQENGKNSEGKLTLSATQRGSWIFVELSDDGKGLDRGKILSRAIERKIVSSTEELTEKEIFELITRPGFSTSEVVSDVSGRGVGMDVVKCAIEKLKGQLDITSVEGMGTSITLRLPLTLAIIDGVIVRVGSERYIIPSSAIVQSIPHIGNATTTIAGQDEVVVYRDEAIPLLRLAFELDVADTNESVAEAILVIVECDNQRFALLVDELLGKQQVVIKSLDAVLKNTAGIAGSAIMPDGTVGLILDVEYFGQSTDCNKTGVAA